MNDILNSDLTWSIISLLCFIPAIVFHEVAHGFVANKLGDPTAKALGRLSLNPIKHIDPFGTVILPILLAFSGMPVFGYAKPVPYNPRYFKNLRKGEVLTGLAGPCANFLLALVGAAVGWFSVMFLYDLDATTGYLVYAVSYYFVFVNLCLMFFNLLPIPPLDGSSIIAVFLSDKALQVFYKIQQYSLPILMVILIVIPMVFNVNPLGWYLQTTAGNLSAWLFSF